jgi:signal transduction histidine kinase
MASTAAQPGTGSALLSEALVPGEPEARGPRTPRDRRVDAAFVLIALAVGFAGFSSEVRTLHPSATWQVIDLAGGIAACAALWVRRRWPVAVALAILPLAAISSLAGPAALLAFFTVAVHRRFAVLAAVAAFGLASLAIYFAVRFEPQPDVRGSLWLANALLVLVYVATAAFGMFIRARRQLLLSLRERAERAEADRHHHAERARELERAQIAREMHDVLAHRISLLSMHAGSLEFRPDAPPEEVARAAGVIRASAHQALQDLREVIGVLRAAPVEEGLERPQPTLADLSALVEESRAAGITVHAAIDVEDAGSAPAALGRNAYRIVQEGLTNARKHARGTTVGLTVTGAAGTGLQVELRNPLPVGRAATEIPGAGSGLLGLAERAALAGGRLEHGPTAAGDHRLWAWLPWPA